MQPTSNQKISIQSLQSLCLENISEHSSKHNTHIADSQEIKNKLPPDLFLKLSNVQDRSVQLKVTSWTNHTFSIAKKDKVSVELSFSDLKCQIKKESGFTFKSILVPDLEWEKEYGSFMVKTVDPRASLQDYGFKPGEVVEIYFEISGLA